jgi:hypothetical protein
MTRARLGPLVALLAGLVVGLLEACGSEKSATDSRPARARVPGVRITMETLHRVGGVPPGWKLTPSPGDVGAGRQAFVDFGCPSCHRIQGEAFAAKETPSQVGPELTGMGAHHPPAYFAEAILNPDAVLIEGPGYIGPDGHSVMPDYPDMTLQQLSDLVTYLGSLTGGMDHSKHMMGGAMLPKNLAPRPAPPVQAAKAFFVQSFDVKAGQLAAFEAWFAADGRRRFLAFDGLVSIDTYVDYEREQAPYTSIFGFRDMDALQRFMNDATAEKLGLEWDAFIGEHGHTQHLLPPVYRAASLSHP